MIVDSALSRVANDLLRARDTASLATLPSRSQAGFDLDKGYQVGRALHEGLVGRGYAPVGRKIGFTNRATWKEFQFDTPIWAHMYTQTVHFADRAAFRLSLSGMAAPRIETEVVLRLRRPIPAGDPSVEELADCVEPLGMGFVSLRNAPLAAD
jgi:2-keto-4-pentenoate hydratase